MTRPTLKPLPRPALVALGKTRAAFVAVAITAATTACVPWRPHSSWLLAGAVVLVALSLASWHGLHLTTLLRRRAALLWRNIRSPGRERVASSARQSPNDAQATALLRVCVPDSDDSMMQDSSFPLALIAEHLDSYGLRCSAIRVTAQEVRSDGRRIRNIWISLTLDAVENLPALRARSPEIPLTQTARAAGRRLADRLRELGWEARLTDEQPPPLVGSGDERWLDARDERGSIAAYQIRGINHLPDTLEQLRAIPSAETWTVLEITGTRARPSVAAGCTLRLVPPGDEQTPLPAELLLARGNQRPLITALHPVSDHRLDWAEPTTGARTMAQLAQGFSTA